ncbi:MAG: HlyC/CorC family transporter, partial [Anaerotignum sp.]|nr:HlyC/CorC family transporter [Anaerotignum sp.]
LIGQLGRIPEDDEVIEIILHGWLFQVEAFEEKRILKVLASKLPEEEPAEENAEEDINEE